MKTRQKFQKGQKQRVKNKNFKLKYCTKKNKIVLHKYWSASNSMDHIIPIIDSNIKSYELFSGTIERFSFTVATNTICNLSSHLPAKQYINIHNHSRLLHKIIFSDVANFLIKQSFVIKFLK